MAAFRTVFITIEPAKAMDMAEKLINEKLAACVNIVNNIQSVYRWQGNVEKADEALLIVKTATKKIENLIKYVRENHGDEVPEVISMTIAEGNPDYLDWLHRETG